MKRFLFLALALAAIGGFVVADAFARGGHGGGHHGGGHHGGHHGSHHHSHHGHHSHHHSHAHTHHHVGHHGNHHAFAHGWNGYGRGAWGWGNGGYAWGNPWGVANWGTTAAWLGLPAVAGGVNTIAEPVYADTANEIAPQQSVATNEQAPDTQDVASNDGDDDDSDGDDADEPITQPKNATALAASGAGEPDSKAKFLPLGVYSIAPEGETEATALLHLAVSKEGVVRGTYHDLKSDKDENIRGAVDKKDHSIAWTIGNQGSTIFHTWLEDLTEQSGPVTEKTADGQTKLLTIAHYTEEDDKKSAEDEKQLGEGNKKS